MVPDFDKRVPGIAHPGPTHTVWFALVIGIGTGAIGGLIGWQRGPLAALGTSLFGVFVGTLTIGAHLLADVLTPTGISPFAPVRDDRNTLDVAKVANPVVNYALLAAGVVVSGAALVVGAWI